MGGIRSRIDADEAGAEAVRLRDAVREHRRAASYHRRAGKRAKMSLVELQKVCDRAGISLHVENNPHEAPKGGQGGEQRKEESA